MSGPEIRKQKGAPCAIPSTDLHTDTKTQPQTELIFPVPMSSSSSATARVIMGS